MTSPTKKETTVYEIRTIAHPQNSFRPEGYSKFYDRLKLGASEVYGLDQVREHLSELTEREGHVYDAAELRIFKIITITGEVEVEK